MPEHIGPAERKHLENAHMYEKRFGPEGPPSDTLEGQMMAQGLADARALDRAGARRMAEQDMITADIHDIAARGGITPTEVREHYNAGVDLDTLDEGSAAWARVNPIHNRIKKMTPDQFEEYARKLRQDHLQESIRKDVRMRTRPAASGYGIYSTMTDKEFDQHVDAERKKFNKRFTARKFR